MMLVLALSLYDREARTLRRDVEERINIANILSNYELLLEHGYRITQYTNNLSKTGFTESGGYTHRIILNKEHLDTSDMDIQFSVNTRRLVLRYGFLDRRVVYIHRLNITSEAVVIDLSEDTSYRRSHAIFDELNLILDVVNLE